MKIWDNPFAEKLKKKNKNILVYNAGGFICTKSLALSNGGAIGCINTDELRDFRKFLDKFGRKLFIEDAIDRLFGESHSRWEINFRLLYSGYQLFRENRAEFEEAVKKCQDKKEFLMAYGMR